MSNINLSSTTPAASAGYTNVVFTNDGINNVSASLLTPATIAGSNTFTGANSFTQNLSCSGVIGGNLGGAGGNAFLIGNDLYLADINAANTMGLQGQQNSAIGALVFGLSGPTLSGTGTVLSVTGRGGGRKGNSRHGGCCRSRWSGRSIVKWLAPGTAPIAPAFARPLLQDPLWYRRNRSAHRRSCLLPGRLAGGIAPPESPEPLPWYRHYALAWNRYERLACSAV